MNVHAKHLKSSVTAGVSLVIFQGPCRNKANPIPFNQGVRIEMAMFWQIINKHAHIIFIVSSLMSRFWEICYFQGCVPTGKTFF